MEKHIGLRRRRPRSRRGQRGAIGVAASFVLILMVLVMALAVDTGRLYSEKRSLQSMADIGALATVNASGFCGYESTVDEGTVGSAVDKALRANGFDPDAQGVGVEVELGQVVSARGLRHFTETDAALADSVYVELTKEVPKSMVAGGLWTGPTTLTAEAAATRQAIASFSVGSYVARTDLGDSMLGPLLAGLLGSSANLAVLDYGGLVEAEVSLGALAESAMALGLDVTVASVDQLLGLQLEAGELFELLATAASRENLLAVEATLGELYKASASADVDIKLGDVIQLGDGTENASAARINLLDLVTASLMNGRAGHAVTLELLGSDLGMLQPGEVPMVTLYVVEPPQLAVGPAGRNLDGEWRTIAHNAQLRLQVHLPVTLDVGGTGVSVNVGLYAEVGKGAAWLESLECGRHPDYVSTATVGASTGLLGLALGAVDDIGSAEPTVLPLLDVDLATWDLASVHLSASAEASDPTAGTVRYPVDYGALETGPMTRNVAGDTSTMLGNLVSSLGSEINVDIELGEESDSWSGVDLIEDTLEDTLELLFKEALAGVVSATGNLVLEPLLTALGTDLAGADVTLHDLETDSTILAY